MTRPGKLTTLLLIILIAFLPFHAFLSTFLNAVLTDGMFSASSYISMGNPFIELQPWLPNFQKTAPTFFLLNPSFYLVIWKELLVLFITLLGGYSILKNFRKIRFDALDYTILFFIFLGVLAVVFREFHVYEWLYGSDFISTSGIREIAYGIKYDFLFLIIFFILKHLSFSDQQKKNIFTVIFFSASIVILFGLIIHFFTSPDFLSHFGYSLRPSYFHPNYPIAYCQLIKFEGACRLQSTFAGPNQLGSYLLIVVPLLLMGWYSCMHHGKMIHDTIIKRTTKFHCMLALGVSLLGILAIFFTYSRGAMLGLIVGIFSLLFLMSKGKKKVAFYLIGIFLFCNLIVVFFHYFHFADIVLESPILKRHAYMMDFYMVFSYGIWATLSILSVAFCVLIPKTKRSIILVIGMIVLAGLFGKNINPDVMSKEVIRFSSLQGHYERSMDGIMYMGKFPIGLGLGRAGPASSRMDEQGIGLLPESWYMQMGLEFGILGLITFIAILMLLGRKFYQNYKQLSELGEYQTSLIYLALLCTLIALSLNALKLHTFEDAGVSIIFWSLAGVMYYGKDKTSS